METNVFDSENSVFAGLATLGLPEQTDKDNTDTAPLSGAVLDSAKEQMADQMVRRDAMAAALTWVDDGDYSFDALDNLVQGLLFDGLGDDEPPESDDPESDPVLDNDKSEYLSLTEDDIGAYNYKLGLVADSLAELGGCAKNIEEFVNDACDEAGDKLGTHILGRLDSSDMSDDDLIDGYAVGGQLIMDATERKVIDGKLVWKKKPLRKKKLSAKQRAALKKARKKANSGAAKKAREKAMRLRKQRGV